MYMYKSAEYSHMACSSSHLNAIAAHSCMHVCIYILVLQAELEQAEERIQAKQTEVEELLIQVLNCILNMLS